ncbi:GvpL/GvpF family gas vesicle protein [Amycolatopsis sp. FU40]|uniref:GvpL/GvpF family gas vesicle protein n=1 Tax=Amycolatopsis sp. FU40 TaxID=2914159 RepID=UPI001F20EDF5|nr:GvpL/GvpF family gas vesicle protein [Amycolatopsis sp. FU40]UKD59147.1 GvpL/GvpF family gas vesicle protein [Amycolatopsis sp. FU40]
MSTYLYGITFADHPADVGDLRGVGPSPAPARVLAAGDELRAVVGDVEGELRAKRRDLLAHQEILQALCEKGPTLPVRFGVVADDDTAVAEEIAAKTEVYTAVLQRVRGHVEMNVKVAHREEAVLGQLLAKDEELRNLAASLREDAGKGQAEQVRFGELVAGRLEEREGEDADAVLSYLLPLASEHSPGPRVDGCFFTCSFLVPQEKTAEFQDAVQRLATLVEEVAEVRAQGPLPPYSFTEGQ